MAKWLSSFGFGRRRERARLRESGDHWNEFLAFAPYRVAARLDGRTTAPRTEVERPLFEQWRRDLQVRLRPAGRSAFEIAREAIALSRSLLVTQRQVNVDILDSFEDGLLREAMTVLVSGLCNCEMANYVVWLALHDAGHAVYPFETGAAEEVGGNHLLLYLVDDTGAAFVDAWSDVACFHLEDYVPSVRDVPMLHRRTIQVQARRRPPGIPTLAELAPRFSREVDGLYPESTFRAGMMRSSFDEIDEAWELTVRDPQPGDPGAVAQVWRDWVELRVRHVRGELADRGELAAYDAFAARDDLPPELREVVEALAARQREAALVTQ